MTDQPARQNNKFSEAALAEADAIAESVSTTLEGRPPVKGITIDGPASKDLDDAFWIEKERHGGYRLLVSITDVGSLITPQATPALYKEALERAFTRYYGETNRPMLPRLLSESKLSLLEGRSRPAITISIPLDARMRPGEPAIYQTCISSSKRFSYGEVDTELENSQNEFSSVLLMAYNIAYRLLQKRKAGGALAIYDIVSGWATTEEGMLRRLDAGERFKAQVIIQELMILTNQACALFLAQRGLPALYRNHKANAIAPERSALLQMMDIAVSHPEQFNPDRVSVTVNVSMQRARYAPIVEGHYGLNLPAYIHLTSPIRRYADLLNQHILLAALKGEPPPYPKEQLAEIAEHINGAEDDMKDAKSAHFLAAYDKEIRKTVVEAAQEPSASPLADLGTKKFHSVIRMAAASDALSPAIEQEILRRLEQQMLYANDIFTLVFRYQNKGEAWEKVRRAALEEIQRQPYLAISILLMGHQSLGWGTPHYEVRPSGVNHRMLFKASVKVTAAEQQYASSQQVATQKELAKQLASAEVLAKIAGIELPSLSSHETSTEVTPPSSEASRDVKLQNYKGQLQELAQSRKWDLPSYTEVARTGPPHAPVFTVEGKITIDGREHTVRCIGNSKTEAEQLAAQQLLQLVPDLPSTAATNALSGGKNPVSVLNEMKQKLELSDVTYTYEQHDITSDQEFTCICSVMTSDDQTIEMAGTGQTKKDATRRAASRALAFLLTGDPEN